MRPELLLLLVLEACLASRCWPGPSFPSSVLPPAALGGAGGMVRVPAVPSVAGCVEAACGVTWAHVSWFFQGRCYVVSCQQRAQCRPQRRPGAQSHLTFIQRSPALPPALFWGDYKSEAPGDLQALKDLGLLRSQLDYEDPDLGEMEYPSSNEETELTNQSEAWNETSPTPYREDPTRRPPQAEDQDSAPNLGTTSLPVSTRMTSLPVSTRIVSLPVFTRMTSFPVSSKTTSFPVSIKTTSLPVSTKTASLPVSTKTASLPVSTKTASLLVSTKTASLPFSTKTASLPVSTKTASLPVSTKTASLPVSTKTASLLVSTKTASLPVSTKTASLPVSTKTASLPVSTKTASLPVSTKMASLPVSTKTASLPVSTKTASLPVSTKTASLPVSTKMASLPVSTKTASLPVSTKTASLPVSTKMASLPVSTKMASLPVSTKTASLPVSTKTASLPVSTKTASLPVSTKTASLPVSTKMASLPVSTKMASLPVSTKMASLPVSTKMASLPVSTKMASLRVSTKTASLPVSTKTASLPVSTKMASLPVSTKTASLPAVVATPDSDRAAGPSPSAPVQSTTIQFGPVQSDRLSTSAPHSAHPVTSAHSDSDLGPLAAPGPAPVAHAGGSYTLSLPNSSIILQGSATNTDLGAVHFLWTRDAQSPAAGDVLFGSETRSALVLVNLVEGSYLFHLRVTDAGGRSALASATVQVLPEPGGAEEVELEMQVSVSQVSVSQRDTVVSQLSALLQVPPSNICQRGLSGLAPLSTVLRFSVRSASGPVPGSSVASLLRNHLLRDRSEYLLFRVLRVDTVVCQLRCSGRGQCDPVSRLCLCDPFWTENLLRTYLGDGQSNCEWRVLYVILSGFILVILILSATWTFMCCCRRKRQTKVRRKTRYRILDNVDEEERVELRPKFSLKHRSTEHNSSLMMSESELSDQDFRDPPLRSRNRTKPGLNRA